MDGWRLRTGAGLIVRQWPGEQAVVLHDPESGDTHLLSREAFACLEAVERGEDPGEEAEAVIADLRHFRLIERRS